MTIRQWLTYLYYFASVAALLASLAILWQVRFPPMQDYPAHMMIAKVLAASGDAGYDWLEHYHVDPKIGPYSASYYVIGLIHRVLPIEDAGKIVIGLYFVFIAIVVLTYSRTQIKQGHIPWLMLLAFPLSYSQVYYLGFLNYLLSIPVLLWLIMDYLAIGQASRSRTCSWLQLLFPLLLFLLHPFTLLLYCGLGGALLAIRKLRKEIVVREHWVPILWLVLFTVWFVSENIGSTRGGTAFPDLYYYWSLNTILHFLILSLVGHHTVPSSGYMLFAWALVIYVILRSGRYETSIRGYGYIVILLLLAYLLLPFNLLGYSYFSSRLIAPMYLFLTMYLAGKVVAVRYVPLIIIFLSISYYDTYQTHVSVSNEIEVGLIPLIEKIPENSTLLPIYINAASESLDNYMYKPFIHAHNYYHVIKGGGVSPGLLYNDMLPVHYSNKVDKLLTKRVSFSYSDLYKAADVFDYMLIRSPIYVGDRIPSTWRPLARGGQWVLYLADSSNSRD